MQRKLNHATFSAPFVDSFAGDHSGGLLSRTTEGVLYGLAMPSVVSSPDLIAWNQELARDFNLSHPDERDIDILSGNLVTESMKPYAYCYGGHQFGHWSGQLGDGRAINLGELISKNHESWELQLKGAGPTPYSRRSDGRAVLRSSVREYLMSEAMHYLGVPTTRALSLTRTGDLVARDMFYNGNVVNEPGAIVTRVSPSFLRFGNFEILAAREEYENLIKLISWTINRFFPEVKGEGEERILNWFERVSMLTADMVVEWMRVGFVHGVMNTDNMSILGLTIDYGPFSMMDCYDPLFTPNTTDLPGRRYAFARQPSIALWNLERLAEAILPLVSGRKSLETILVKYQRYFSDEYYKMMARKLGLDRLQDDNDYDFIVQTDALLKDLQIDMTLFYRTLAKVEVKQNYADLFETSLYHSLSDEEKLRFNQYIDNYLKRINRNSFDRQKSRELMNKTNPCFILRNYLLYEAIKDLEEGSPDKFEELKKAIVFPYEERNDELTCRRPDWASNQAGCSTLSCSS